MKYVFIALLAIGLISCTKSEKAHCWTCVKKSNGELVTAQCNKTEKEIREFESKQTVIPVTCYINE